MEKINTVKQFMVDSDPMHFITNLPSDDPRRFADDCCVFCGLLSEFHARTDQVIQWSPEYKKYHYHTVCGPKCREGFISMMESLEKEANYQ